MDIGLLYIDEGDLKNDCETVERLETWLEKDKTKNNVQRLLFSHININSLSAHFDNYLATTQKLIGTADFLAISEK